LGVTAIWLLPFYPSPLKDDGYDIADYCACIRVRHAGRFQKVFARGAPPRLRVITELVLNHTSDQHPWFQRARRAKPGSRWRNFYVWSDTPANIKTRASSLRTWSSPTGPGTTWPTPISGIASFRTSPI
jgi:maltose alpha-D-glucosyltransferase / alpha-amylase